ncbi:MAG: regulatory protein RecX [Thermoanaerobaculum sp.]
MGPKKAKSAHAVALELLNRRALSEDELRQKLLKRGFGSKEVEEELTRLRRLGLVSDLELARMVVRTKLGSGHGPWALRASLRQRGIAPKVGEQVLAELAPEDEVEAMSRALEKALRRFENEEASHRRQKVVRYLLSRGFGLSAALRATEFLGGELDEDALVEPGAPDEIP